MLAPFDLLIPKTLEEAIGILAEKGDRCKILAGGTDVFVDMHGKYEHHAYLMDIKQLPELKEFQYIPGESLTIGALTTHHFLDRSAVTRSHFPALYEGASQVGSVQIRQRGTIGGNICNAVPSGDTLSPLLVLDAKVLLAGIDGIREMPLEEFLIGPKKTALAPGELLVKIILPDPGESKSAYIKFTRRGAMDLALLGASAAIGLDSDGVCRHIRIGLTTSHPFPCELVRRRPCCSGINPRRNSSPAPGLSLPKKRSRAAAGAARRVTDATRWKKLYRG